MKGNISFSSLLLCFRSVDSLPVNFISDRGFLSKFVGSLCQSGVCLQDSQGFSFDKSFFNTWQVTRDKMCVLEGFRFLFKCVFPSRIDFSLNLVPLYTTINLVPRFYLLPVGENPGNKVVQLYLKTQTQGHIFRP